jgi:hypothetical protein
MPKLRSLAMGCLPLMASFLLRTSFLLLGTLAATSHAAEPAKATTSAPTSPSASTPANPPPATANATQEFTWDDLIPPDYRPEAVMGQIDVSSMQDGDPKAIAAMDKLRALWKEAPVVKELDGRKIKLGGFAVPLDGDGKITTEFLLVPYYGACIHVPPPPANQAILITLDKPQDIIKQPFDAVWVEGVIKIERFSNDLADAGYAMKNAVVTPYEE